jgi:regulator-associated protein of mTOR
MPTHIPPTHAHAGSVVHDTARLPPSRVVYMRQLNESDSNLLLAASADGAVAVWRSYLKRGNQRLATAWQAVEIHQPPVPLARPAAFELAPSMSSLYAAGGSSPDVVQRWDLMTEMGCPAIHVRTSDEESSCPVAVERLSAGSVEQSLLLAGCSDGAMRLFDLRAPRSALHCLQAVGRGSSLVGMVLEPGGRHNTIVAASSDGDMRLLDMRMMAGGGGVEGSALPKAEVLCIKALTQKEPSARPGSLNVLAAHPHAPLIATGSSGQEVRVWTHSGELVSGREECGGGVMRRRRKSMERLAQDIRKWGRNSEKYRPRVGEDYCMCFGLGARYHSWHLSMEYSSTDTPLRRWWL